MQWVTMSTIICIKCKIYFSNVFHWLQWVALSAGSELHLLCMICIEFNKLHRVHIFALGMGCTECNEFKPMPRAAIIA